MRVVAIKTQARAPCMSHSTQTMPESVRRVRLASSSPCRPHRNQRLWRWRLRGREALYSIRRLDIFCYGPTLSCWGYSITNADTLGVFVYVYTSVQDKLWADHMLGTCRRCCIRTPHAHCLVCVPPLCEWSTCERDFLQYKHAHVNSSFQINRYRK